MEIALFKQSKVGTDEAPPNELATAVKSIQSEFIKFSSTFNNTNTEKINGLSEKMHALRLRLVNPIQNQVSMPIILISTYGYPLFCL